MKKDKGLLKYKNIHTGDIVEIDPESIETYGYGNSDWDNIDEQGIYNFEDNTLYLLSQGRWNEQDWPTIDGKKASKENVEGSCEDGKLYIEANNFGNLDVLYLEDQFSQVDWELVE